LQAGLKRRWAELDPARKKKAVILSIVLVVLIISFLGYRTTRGGKPKTDGQAKEPGRELSLDSKILEKSMYYESRKEIADLKTQLEDLKKLKEEKEAAKDRESNKDLEAFNRKLAQSQPPVPRYFPPPPAASSSLPPIMPPSPEGQPQKPKAEMLGDIEIVSGQPSVPGQPTEAKAEKAADAKKKSTVYLPPSFMEATLLSGLDAPTVDSAKGQPVPVLLRVKDLAVLPNKVKANLKGCFVIGEGYGSLSDERAHLRLVTLSCIAKNGDAVIDQKVKGFVVDEDGKIGLRGVVVSKMGSVLARSMLAGFFGGLGQAVQASSTTTSISALGTTQTIQPSELLKAGAGGGIAQGASELQKFYLELARQSLPVVEVGATKNVTLVISEGVDLEIRDFCNRMGGGRCKD
jgi:conjugal transfer pilus assembly protein TraB